MQTISHPLNRAYTGLITHVFGFMNTRECPLCGWTGFQFLPTKAGPFFRFDAKCPKCSSFERHRLAYLLLKSEFSTRLGAVLHFAPEAPISKWLAPLTDNYQTADLSSKKVMHKVDIQNMPFEDANFDLLWCSHVLEHVPNDAKAMREARRVLRPGGKMIVQVPIWGESTVDGLLNSDAERLTRYFQEDHLRLYGRDIGQRLQAAGFAVTTRHLHELPLQAVLRHSLTGGADAEVFIATAV